jgi:hypothetical protein
MNFRTATPADIDARMVALQIERDRIERELAAIDAEWTRRGGWTRAFVVPGGHAHTSTACSTCYPTTMFALVTRMSGATEEAIVEEAGERACTVCYPSAPVETLRRPTRLLSEDEEAERAARETARAEREAARAKRDAEAITVEGLNEYRGRAHTFKSERALQNFVSANLKNLHIWTEIGAINARPEHPSAPEWREDARKGAEALAERRGVDVEALLADLDAKAAKNAAREMRG